jgi:hypothetical protein
MLQGGPAPIAIAEALGIVRFIEAANQSRISSETVVL